jgi:oligosaccharide repeat unit polymerase
MLAKNYPNTYAYAPWWINPFWYSSIMLLGMYVVTVYFSDEIIRLSSGQKVNSLNGEGILLGLLSVLSIAVGSSFVVFRQKSKCIATPYSANNINQVLLCLGVFIAICYAAFVLPLLAHPGVVIRVFIGGSWNSVNDVRGSMGSTPGISSFLNADAVFYSLYGYAVSVFPKKKINPYVHILFYACLLIDAFIAIASARRNALVRSVTCYVIPIVIFKWKRTTLRNIFPVIGMFFMYVFFAFGEYFRSWRYYRNFGQNFFEFTALRFLGYIATSLNNGAGLYEMHGPYYKPLGTVQGLYDILAQFGYKNTQWKDQFLLFQGQFGSLEFNNPCGLYVPYVDFGPLFGSVVLVLIGVYVAYLYKKILRHAPLGILLFPVSYFGILFVFNIFMWGDTIYIRPLIVAVIVSCFLKENREESQPKSMHNQQSEC